MLIMLILLTLFFIITFIRELVKKKLKLLVTIGTLLIIIGCWSTFLMDRQILQSSLLLRLSTHAFIVGGLITCLIHSIRDLRRCNKKIEELQEKARKDTE